LCRTRRCFVALVSSVVSEYAIRKVQENQAFLKLNATHHLGIYAYNMILLVDNIGSSNNTGPLIDDSKEAGVEIKVVK
jgi:hypothetical protein